MDRAELDDLVTRNDPDALVRLVDGLTAGRDWDGLLAVAAACRAATATGRQLWPVASLAEYRLALRAPGPWAAGVVRDDAGYLSLGPLSEVAASSHTWAELAPGLDTGPITAFVAHERVLRGEDLTAVDVPTDVLDLPLVLQRWEPAYALAVYEDDAAHFDPPALPRVEAVELPSSPGPDQDGDEGARALLELAGHWARDSNGRLEAVAVDGDERDAIAALGVTAARLAPLPGAGALAWMAWAAASGGAHGRRRGSAAGRFGAWWTAAALAGLDWPPEPDELAAAVAELRWFWWDAHEPTTGWQLRLAVRDPVDGLAWALTASDDD